MVRGGEARGLRGGRSGLPPLARPLLRGAAAQGSPSQLLPGSQGFSGGEGRRVRVSS